MGMGCVGADTKDPRMTRHLVYCVSVTAQQFVERENLIKL